MNFISAFIQEAQPLIDELDLKKKNLPSPFTLFKNKHHHLVISGMGRKNMSLAVSFLHGIHPQKNTPWLNLGLCGHGNAQLGTPFQIAKCQSEHSEKSIYPPQLFSTSLQKTILQTVDQPTLKYEPGVAYDMEGIAFFKTASLFSPSELVQSLKIVSDNPEHPFSQFKKNKTRSLITPCLPQIISLAKKMNELAEELVENPQLQPTLDQALTLHSFTETQVHQLKKFIRHSLVLGITPAEIFQSTKNLKSAKSTIAFINNLVEQRKIFP